MAFPAAASIPPGTALSTVDEAALTSALACVRVSAEDFDLGAEVQQLRALDWGVGAVASFVGTVREWHHDTPAPTGRAPGSDGGVAPVLELEHYPGMTERSIATLIVQARQRFDVRGVRVIHRVGPLALGDQIVLVAVSSAHRGEAFACCEFLMDWLKTQAPFWKKEISAQGSRWVDARQSDEAAAARWGALPVSPNKKDPA